jgi:hypothetical protein
MRKGKDPDPHPHPDPFADSEHCSNVIFSLTLDFSQILHHISEVSSARSCSELLLQLVLLFQEVVCFATGLFFRKGKKI